MKPNSGRRNLHTTTRRITRLDSTTETEKLREGEEASTREEEARMVRRLAAAAEERWSG